MVKTTINLDTEVYRALVEEAVRRYGTTKRLSMIINEKLRASGRHGESIAEETFGIWNIKETGAEYVRKLRDEAEEREKKLGL